MEHGRVDSFFSRFQLSNRQIAEMQKASRYRSRTSTEDAVVRVEELRAGTRSDSVSSAESTQCEEFEQESRDAHQNRKRKLKSLAFDEQKITIPVRQFSSDDNRITNKNQYNISGDLFQLPCSTYTTEFQGTPHLSNEGNSRGDTNVMTERNPTDESSLQTAELQESIAVVSRGLDTCKNNLNGKYALPNDLIGSYSDSSPNSLRKLFSEKHQQDVVAMRQCQSHSKRAKPLPRLPGKTGETDYKTNSVAIPDAQILHSSKIPDACHLALFKKDSRQGEWGVLDIESMLGSEPVSKVESDTIQEARNTLHRQKRNPNKSIHEAIFAKGFSDFHHRNNHEHDRRLDARANKVLSGHAEPVYQSEQGGNPACSRIEKALTCAKYPADPGAELDVGALGASSKFMEVSAVARNETNSSNGLRSIGRAEEQKEPYSYDARKQMPSRVAHEVGWDSNEMGSTSENKSSFQVTHHSDQRDDRSAVMASGKFASALEKEIVRNPRRKNVYQLNTPTISDRKVRDASYDEGNRGSLSSAQERSESLPDKGCPRILEGSLSQSFGELEGLAHERELSIRAVNTEFDVMLQRIRNLMDKISNSEMSPSVSVEWIREGRMEIVKNLKSDLSSRLERRNAEEDRTWLVQGNDLKGNKSLVRNGDVARNNNKAGILGRLSVETTSREQVLSSKIYKAKHTKQRQTHAGSRGNQVNWILQRLKDVLTSARERIIISWQKVWKRGAGWLPHEKRLGQMCGLLGVFVGLFFCSSWFIVCVSLAVVHKELVSTG